VNVGASRPKTDKILLDNFLCFTNVTNITLRENSERSVVFIEDDLERKFITLIKATYEVFF